MGGAVGADQSGAVEGEAHRQLLDGDVVHDLVVAALKECGIDRGEGLHPLAGEARGEGDAVLLGDANRSSAWGNARRIYRGRCRRHRRGDGDNALVDLGLGDQRLGEDAGVAGRARLALTGRGGDVELDHA